LPKSLKKTLKLGEYIVFYGWGYIYRTKLKILGEFW